jgi:hypothetical protein
VSLVDRGIRSQAIEITPTFNVVDPHACSAFYDHVERMIVMRAEFIFQVDKILCAIRLLNL